MVSFNNRSTESTLTTNAEGGEAYKILDKKAKLYNLACVRLFGEPKFYKDNADTEILTLIDSIVAEGDPKFPLQLAKYIRNDMYLRTTPLVILGHCSLIKACQPYIKLYAPQIIKRADEMAEVIAYIKHVKGHIGNLRSEGSLPSALKKAIATKFWTFNKYQLQKYLEDSASVKMRDVIKLTHPKPKTEEDSKFLKDIIEGKVTTPTNTWEHYISVHGSNKESWTKITPDLPIMALLRNLRNILDAGVDASIINEHVINKLTNEKIILNSKQFPFRFWSAYQALNDNTNVLTRKVKDALQTAMDISVANIPRLSGITAIGTDHSGSMEQHISGQSTVMASDIGDVLLAMGDGICDHAIPFAFGDNIKVINNITPRAGVLVNKSIIEQVGVGGGTTNPIFEYFTQNAIEVDRFIVFSDEQTYKKSPDECQNDLSPRAALGEYRKHVNKNVRCYFVNLVGSGKSAVPLDNPLNVQIMGWNEKIFDYINRYETDSSKVVKEIQNL